MKRNDEINHGMIDKLVCRGHDQDHQNVLDYVNERAEKIKKIKYQAECPFCHDHHNDDFWSEPDKLLFNGKGKNPDDGWWAKLNLGIYEDTIGFEVEDYEDSWAGVFEIKYCPMCGRRLTEDEDEKS